MLESSPASCATLSLFRSAPRYPCFAPVSRYLCSAPVSRYLCSALRGTASSRSSCIVLFRLFSAARPRLARSSVVKLTILMREQSLVR